MLKQKVYLHLENLTQLNLFKFGFCANNFVFGRYLFQLIVPLKPDFNCGNSFALFWVDKITTGTWRVVSII